MTITFLKSFDLNLLNYNFIIIFNFQKYHHILNSKFDWKK